MIQIITEQKFSISQMKIFRIDLPNLEKLIFQVQISNFLIINTIKIWKDRSEIIMDSD